MRMIQAVGVAVGCLLTAHVPASVQPSPSYPEAYRVQKLPELPGATLVASRRQGTSLRDGIRVRLTSPKPPSEIREFYSSALEQLGWKAEDSPAMLAAQANPLLTMLTFARGRLTFAVIIAASPQAGETQISINAVER